MCGALGELPCERSVMAVSIGSNGTFENEGASHMTTLAKPAKASGEFSIGGKLPVTRLGYGTMRLTGPGVWGDPKDPGEALRVLRRAVELGVNFLDTADSYGPAVAEPLIKKALHPYPA